MNAMGAVFFFFSEELTALFIKDPEVLYWGSVCVKIAALEQAPIALNYCMGGALRGAGDTKWPMYVTTIGILGNSSATYFFVHYHLEVPDHSCLVDYSSRFSREKHDIVVEVLYRKVEQRDIDRPAGSTGLSISCLSHCLASMGQIVATHSAQLIVEGLGSKNSQKSLELWLGGIFLADDQVVTFLLEWNEVQFFDLERSFLDAQAHVSFAAGHTTGDR